MLTLQTVPATVVQPDQLAKTEVASGVAVSVTTVAGVVFGTDALHTPVAPAPQSMPPPLTFPLPVPPVVTASGYVLGENVAMTNQDPLTDTVQTSPVAEVQPSQLVKTDPASGVAVRVTTVGGLVLGTEMLHTPLPPVAQSMPPPLTRPFPVPEATTVSG
jgi:hypothetical protein